MVMLRTGLQLELNAGQESCGVLRLERPLAGESLSTTKSQAKPRLGVKSVPNSEEARSAEVCDDRAAAR